MSNSRKVFYSGDTEYRNLPIGTEYILDGIPRIRQCDDYDKYDHQMEHDHLCRNCDAHKKL